MLRGKEKERERGTQTHNKLLARAAKAKWPESRARWSYTRYLLTLGGGIKEGVEWKKKPILLLSLLLVTGHEMCNSAPVVAGEVSVRVALLSMVSFCCFLPLAKPTGSEPLYHLVALITRVNQQSVRGSNLKYLCFAKRSPIEAWVN